MLFHYQICTRLEFKNWTYTWMESGGRLGPTQQVKCIEKLKLSSNLQLYLFLMNTKGRGGGVPIRGRVPIRGGGEGCLLVSIKRWGGTLCIVSS